MEQLLNESKLLAIFSLKKLFINIDLDPEIFSHLYNIEIVVGETENLRAKAEYDPNDNTIIINENYIIKLNEYREKGKIIKNIACTIIHEIIHANRTIFINKGINIINKSLLMFDTEIEDNTNCAIVSDYYTHYNNSHYFKNIDAEKYTNISLRLKNQYFFEEIITETLSIIAIMARNEDKLDLDEITKKIETYSFSVDEKAGAKFIRIMGLDFIKWFMTSVYFDFYDDFVERKFQDKYDELLYNFSILYLNEYQTEKEIQAINHIDNIIKNKSQK